jgi:hypothetical protein
LAVTAGSIDEGLGLTGDRKFPHKKSILMFNPDEINTVYQ